MDQNQNTLGTVTPSPKRRIYKIIGVNLLLLLIGLLILELVFGTWFTPNHTDQLHVPRNERIYYDASQLYAGGSSRVLYTRDKYGLRGNYGSPKEIKILTIGGSTTDQRFVPDGQTWQDVIAQEFLEKDKRKVNIANAGCDGHSTFGHLASFQYWFPRIPNLHPKFYLFYVGVNDYYLSKARSFDTVAKRRLKEGRMKFSINSYLRENSAFYHLGRTLWGIWYAQVNKAGHHSLDFSKQQWTDTPLLTNHCELAAPYCRMYADRLRELATAVKDLGGIPVFVTQDFHVYKKTKGGIVGITTNADSYQGTACNGLDQYYIMRELNNTLLDVAKETGSIGIDISLLVDWEDADFYDQAHNTPQGARKIGEAIYKGLRDPVLAELKK